MAVARNAPRGARAATCGPAAHPYRRRLLLRSCCNTRLDRPGRTRAPGARGRRGAYRLRCDAFSGARATFARDVSIETSDDGAAWEQTGFGRIERFSDGSGSESFAFPERTAKFVRVSVADGNDEPLAGATPQLAAVPHDIVFEASAGHTYRLLSNDPGARSPTYDLAARLAHEPWTAAVAFAEPTHAFVGYVGPADERTLTQRYPWLLSLAIGTIAIVLALFAIATLRRANA